MAQGCCIDKIRRSNHGKNIHRHHAHLCEYRQSSGAKRPSLGWHDLHVHRKGREGVEEPGEGHADANHRPYMDEGRSRSNDRPTARVQQLPKLLSLHHQLCRPNLRILSRDRPIDRQYGRFYQTVRGAPQQCAGGSALYETQQNLSRADYEQRRDSQRHTSCLFGQQQDDRKGTRRNRLWYTSKAQSHEQEIATTHHCREVHVHGRHLERNTRRRTASESR